MNKNKRFKLTTSTANLLCDYVNDYGGKDVLQTNGKFIKCNICNSDLGSNKIPPKRFQIKQHVESEMHLKHLELKKSKQPMIEFKTNEENNFNMDLCDTILKYIGNSSLVNAVKVYFTLIFVLYIMIFAIIFFYMTLKYLMLYIFVIYS